MKFLNIRFLVTIITFIQLLSPTVSLKAMKRKPNEENISQGSAKKQKNAHYPADEFGSKTENLGILDALVKKINLPHDFAVQVPSFVGISDRAIKAFLGTQNFNLQELWENIAQHYRKSNSFDTFLQDAQALGKNIYDIFEKLAQSNNLTDLDFLNGEVKNLIFTIASHYGLVTARSSGPEDTDTVMNAGGNDTKEVVQPNIKDILLAIGSVLQSYFGAKSFEQRNKEHDDQLLQCPLLSILIQEVVGEINGNSVVSGVAYTQESLGDTPNIAMVQALYGHGKAVVDNVLPCDTYYLNCSTNEINRIIMKKKHRLAPGTDALHQTQNAPYAQKQSVLNDDTLESLAVVLKEIQNYYQKPMDVEFVINQEKKTMYLVQARPCKRRSHQSITPTYFSSHVLEQCNPSTIISCSKVNYVDGVVRCINNSHQIIAATTLNDALDLFLHDKKYENAVVAIVQGNAELLSHAGATLSGAGITILTTPNISPLKKLLEQPVIKLFFDLQQGLIINSSCNSLLNNKTIETLKKNKLIIEGYCSHPIPSLMTVQKIHGPFNKQEASHTSAENLEELIQTIKESNQDIAYACLKNIQQMIFEKIDELYELSNNNTPIQIIAEKTLSKMYPLAHEFMRISSLVEQALHHPPRSIERLYPITFLEALLFQNPKQGVIGNYSYQSLMKEFDEIIRFLETKIIPLMQTRTIDDSLCKNYKLLKFAQAASKVTLTDFVENKFIQFIGQAAQYFDEHQNKDLICMLNDIVNLEMLPAWTNTRFASQGGTAQEIFNTLFTEYQQDYDFLIQLKLHKDLLKQVSLDAWQEDINFQQLKNAFDSEIFNWFVSLEFTNIIKNPALHPFAYQAAVSTMHKLISAFDQIIKSIKSSNKLDIQVRAEHFKVMVGKYLELLQYWAYLVREGFIQYNNDWPLESYLNKLQEIFNQCAAHDTELLPSPNFNVIPASLGSATALQQFCPKTLEDLFTTTHQSLLVICSALNLCIHIPQCALPESLINIVNLFDHFDYHAQFAQTDFQHFKSIAMGTIFNQNSACIVYNIPLRDHGITITINHLYKNDFPTINVNLYGLNGFYRWDMMDVYLNLLKHANDDICISNKIAHKTNRSFDIMINQKTCSNILGKVFEEIIEIAFFQYPQAFIRMLEIDKQATLLELLKAPIEILITDFLEKFDPPSQQEIINKFSSQKIIKNFTKQPLVLEKSLDIKGKLERTFPMVINLKKKLTQESFDLINKINLYISEYIFEFFSNGKIRCVDSFLLSKRTDNQMETEIKSAALDCLFSLCESNFIENSTAEKIINCISNALVDNNPIIFTYASSVLSEVINQIEHLDPMIRKITAQATLTIIKNTWNRNEKTTEIKSWLLTLIINLVANIDLLEETEQADILESLLPVLIATLGDEETEICLESIDCFTELIYRMDNLSQLQQQDIAEIFLNNIVPVLNKNFAFFHRNAIKTLTELIKKINVFTPEQQARIAENSIIFVQQTITEIDHQVRLQAIQTYFELINQIGLLNPFLQQKIWNMFQAVESALTMLTNFVNKMRNGPKFLQIQDLDDLELRLQPLLEHYKLLTQS